MKPGDAAPDPIDLDQYGEWINSQDPLTGDIVRKWIPYPDDPSTPGRDESVHFGTIPCLARGVVDGGIRVAGNTEWFGSEYENMEFVKMWTPPKVKLTKRDRVTNIRNKKTDQILWVDEERVDGSYQATVFNVNGVTPLFDAFNKHVENFVLLERAEV